MSSKAAINGRHFANAEMVRPRPDQVQAIPGAVSEGAASW